MTTHPLHHSALTPPSVWLPLHSSARERVCACACLFLLPLQCENGTNAPLSPLSPLSLPPLSAPPASLFCPASCAARGVRCVWAEGLVTIPASPYQDIARSSLSRLPPPIIPSCGSMTRCFVLYESRPRSVSEGRSQSAPASTHSPLPPGRSSKPSPRCFCPSLSRPLIRCISHISAPPIGCRTRETSTLPIQKCFFRAWWGLQSISLSVPRSCGPLEARDVLQIA